MSQAERTQRPTLASSAKYLCQSLGYLKMPITSFKPPKRILLGPGPSDVHPRVLAALGAPTIGHLDPEFIRMMDELKSLTSTVWRLAPAWVILPARSGGSA